MNTNTQHRVMHTYEVRLSTPDLDPVTERVNLSYLVNEGLDAVDDDGAVVTPLSIAAKIEVMKRLRRLAAREATTATTAHIDQSDWDIRLTRTSFVTVPVDESGRPIPHRSR